MQLPTPLLAALETAFNTWLKLDETALPRFSELDGKIIKFHITGIDLNLYFFPTGSLIQILGNYPEEDGGIVDATITGSPLDLIRLSTSNNSGKTLLESDVEIDGEMRIAEKFSSILQAVNIDWEAHLSNITGGFVAHEATKTSQNFVDWFSENIQIVKDNTKEYLVDESEMTPSSTEINTFMDHVDITRMDVDRLASRIKNLQQQNND